MIELEPSTLTLLLGLVAFVLAVLAWGLATLLRRAAREASVVDLDPPAPDTDVAVHDLRWTTASPRLAAVFNRGVRLVRRAYPGRGWRYRVPWLLALGSEEAGTGALLSGAGLELPFGAPESEPGGNAAPGWWLFDHAVVLDVPAVRRTVSDESGSSSLWGLLARTRGRRPADGALVALPASELLACDPQDPESRGALARRARRLRHELDDAQERLGMRLPVCLVLTRSERIPGFSALAAGATAAERRQMLGWSTDAEPDAELATDAADQAIASVRAALGERWPGDALGGLSEPLRIVVGQLFAASGEREAPALRGIYFAGNPPDDSAVAFVADLLEHKLLFEWSLARPTAAAAAAGRRRLRLAQGFVLAMLFSLTVGVAWSTERVRAAAADLVPFLDRAKAALETAQDGDDQETALTDSRGLIRAADRLGDYRLRSLFLPASWLGGGETVEAIAGVYEEVVFAALSDQLDSEYSTLAAAEVAAPSKDPIYTLYDTGEFSELRGLVEGLGRLDLDRQRFACFAAGCAEPKRRLLAGFNDLSSDLLDVHGLPPVRLAPPTGRARSFYAAVLRRARPEPYAGAGNDAALQQRATDLGEGMHERLLRHNQLSHQLDHLIVQLAKLSHDPASAAAANAYYHRLSEAIDATALTLALPTLAWVDGPTFEPGAARNGLLAGIAASPELGPSTSATIRHDGEARFQRFRSGLAVYSTSFTGPLLARRNGIVERALAQPVLDLQIALRDFLGEDFMALETDERLRQTPPSGRRLVWDALPLEEAVALAASHDDWVQTTLPTFPRDLRPALRRTARRSLGANLLERVAEAQTFWPALTEGTPQEREQALATEVGDLKAVAGADGPLLLTLAALHDQDLEDEYRQAAAVLEEQVLTLFDRLQAVRDDLAPYVPAAGAIAGWNGRPGLAYSAFAAADGAALGDLTKGWQEHLSALNDDYAGPLLVALDTAHRGRAGGDRRPEPAVADWRRIASDLADYAAKKPGNPLATLEDLVAPTMEGLTLERCFGEVSAAPGPCYSELTPRALRLDGCDFFLAARETLRQEVRSRCDALADEEGYAGYLALAQLFARDLQDRFPFAAPETAARLDLLQAEPARLRDFFALYDRHRVVIENVPAPSPRFGDALPRVQRFMRRMAAVETFLAPFLADDEPGAVPSYGFEVEFRVRRDRELLANEIIEWELAAGESRVEVFGEVSSGIWSYGQPAALTVRWAQDGPRRPAGPLASPAAAVEARTVEYRYRTPWALLGLLVENSSRRQSLPAPGWLRRQTVEVRVPTVPAGEAPPDAGASDALAFVEVALSTPDEAKTPLRVPRFPRRAPAVDRGGR